MITEQKLFEASRDVVMRIFADGFEITNKNGKSDLIDSEGLEYVAGEIIKLVQSSFLQGYEEGKKDAESVALGQ